MLSRRHTATENIIPTYYIDKYLSFQVIWNEKTSNENHLIFVHGTNCRGRGAADGFSDSLAKKTLARASVPVFLRVV